MMDFLMSIFLVDVALSFLGSTQTDNVCYVSTLLTLSNIVAFVCGLLLGFLCARIKYKTLLMAGLLCVAVGALGCWYAPSFFALQIFYPLDGIGTVLIGAMAYALAGEHLAPSKKAKAIGYILAGSPISGLIGSFVITLFFGETAGWRSFMLLYVLPISLVALIVVYFSVPSAYQSTKTVDESTWKQKLRDAFPSKSAVACLAGNLCRYLATAWGMFGIAFARVQLGLSTGFGATIVLIGNVGLISGMVLGGYLVNRFGRKNLAIISVFTLALMLLGYIASVSLGQTWLAVGFWMANGFVGGINYTSSINLTLEQAPKSRGPLMSVNSAFIYLGVALGGGLGGLLLGAFSYQVVGVTFAMFLFASSAILLTLTRDPCKQSPLPSA
jgi:predicted MFS family arabinose efflux permease